jgi:hypothetical protein
VRPGHHTEHGPLEERVPRQKQRRSSESQRNKSGCSVLDGMRDGKFVGGSDILLEMFQNGELQKLLAPKS